MGSVTWSRRALQDVASIVRYTEQYDPTAAKRISGELFSVTGVLERFPLLGRARPDEQREWVVKPYVIVYHVRARSTVITRVWHGAQRRD